MESYEKIKKELMSLNLPNFDEVSSNVISRLIKEKMKKKENKNLIITLSLISIGVILIVFLGRKLWKR